MGWNATTIKTGTPNKAYDEGWERIFGKKKDEELLRSREVEQEVLDHIDEPPPTECCCKVGR